MATLIEELRLLLNQVCEGRQATTAAALVQLEDNLIGNKLLLTNLLQDLPKKPEHRTALISGKSVINGKEHRVNEDFIKQSIYISDHLNLDEFSSARLLLEGISQAATVNSTPLDTAIYLYHAERGYILTILNIILEAAKDYSIEEPIRFVFKKFMGELVKEKSTNGSFIKRIIQSTKDISVMSVALSKNGMLDSAKDCKQQLLTQLSTQYPQQAQDGSLAASIQEMDFGFDTLELRKDKLNEESISLVQILYHISSLFWLPEDDVLDILTKVQSMNLSDPVAVYMLTALLATLSFDGYKREGIDFSKNDAFIKKLHDQITNKSWKVNALEAVVHIQWALFISNISTTLTFDKNQLVKAAIASDAFGFMNNYLLYFKQKEEPVGDKKNTIKSVNDDSSAMELDGLIVDPNDYTKFNVDINPDFQKFVVYELELLTQSFIIHMFYLLSELKPGPFDDPSTLSHEKVEEINNTIVKFLTLLASIYRNRMNAGLKFWNHQNSKLHRLLILLADLKLPQCCAASFDFFGSISVGVESADQAHKMFVLGISKTDLGASNMFSWGKLFSALQFYGKELSDIKSDEEPFTISSIEEDALIKYLYLCQQVVQYSHVARLEIWSNPLLSTHTSIFTMINCPTSDRLRAALYDLLAAFCSNWGGGIKGVGKKIALEVWDSLEFSEMFIVSKVMVVQPTEAVKSTPAIAAPTQNTLFVGLNTAILTSTPEPTPPKKQQQYFLPEQPSGFLREFEEEKSRKYYTRTQSVLNLLASLIHTPSKRDELVSGFSLIEPSIPRLLGYKNNRPPGAAPYISLVIDHIFLNLKNIQYTDINTRWSLTESCLAIIENSIVSFDIDPLVDHIQYITKDTKINISSYTDIFTGIPTPAETTHSSVILETALLAAVTQPGYNILVRILSGGGLIHELFKIVEKGKASISKSIKEDKNEQLKDCMTRCLRIFSKVFAIQNAFVNVIMPQLKLSSTQQTMGYFKLGDFTFPAPPPSLRSLGNLMLNNNEVIVQIALMVNCDEYEDICKLSTTVLSELATQPQDNSVKFPNHINIPMGGIGSSLAGVLLSSPRASSVIFSLSERLEIDSAEVITYDDYEFDMNIIPFWLAEETMGNIYGFKEDDRINDTLSVRITILDMLLKNMSKEMKSPTVTEFLLGYDVKELETAGVQLKSIPTDVQHKSQLACFLSILDMLSKGIEYKEGIQEEPLILTHPVLAEKCYQLIYQLCARESTSNATLHYLRNSTNDFLVKQFKSIACRLETCVRVSEPYFRGTLISADGLEVPTDYYVMVSCLHQRAWLLKLIALELHLKVTKQGSSSALLNLLYGSTDVPNTDTVNDLTSQVEMLNLQLDANYQQPRWNMLEIVNSLEFSWVDGLSDPNPVDKLYFKAFDEEKYTIEKDGYKIYDIRTIFKVLRQHQITHPMCLNLNDSERIAMEKEMGSILRKLMAENRHREISNARLHCLRAWKQVVQVTISDCFDTFSFEIRENITFDLLSVLLPKLENGTGLHVDIFKGLAEVTLSLLTRLRQDKRRQSILRVTANAKSESRLPDEKLRLMFNSIINCIRKNDSTIEVRSAMYSALVNLLQYIKPEDGSEETVPGDIRAQVIEIIAGESKEKLLDIICTDASKGQAMYKTTAYMALEVLYVLVTKSINTAIHSYLAKRNFLQFTISMIKISDGELTKVIQNRDASLIPMYNHEAKISLFMQMALKREGAALLLSNDLINSINNCQFINTRFSCNQFSDPDNAFKVERHARLVTPILELMDALLVSIGSELADQYGFKAWVKNQEVLLNILKDENTKTTLSVLYMLQLTTSILYQLSCQTHYFDDMENSRLKELDSLMMNLIPKYCLSRNWASVVEPVGLEEIAWSKHFLPDTVGLQDSILVAKAEKHITHIRKNLIAYARSSTFRTIPVGKQSFKPVIANTLVSIKEQTNTLSRVSLTTPSLTTLVSCLSHTGKRLSKAYTDNELLISQKDNVGSLKYEEIQEIANTAIPKGLEIKFESLNPSQQFQLLTKEINHRIKLKHKEIKDLKFLLENVLMILWRHLAYYLDSGSISRTTTISPCERYADETVVLLQQMLYQTTPALIEKLRILCQQELEPVFERMESSSLTLSISSSILDRIRTCYH